MGWSMAHGTADDARLGLVGTGAVLKRTFRYGRAYRRGAVSAAGLLVLWTLTLLAGPLLVRRGIDEGIAKGNGGQLNVSIAMYVVVAVASYLSFRFAIVQLAKVGEAFLRDMRTRVFDKLLQQSMAFYDREKAGVLVSRMTSDVDSLQELVQFGLVMFTSAALLLVGTTMLLFLLS